MQDWLTQRAARSPERVALYFGTDAWTFRELDARVTRAAGALGERGIGAGDRVALLLRNSQAYVVLVHALARVGAVLVPLNTRLTAEELNWQVSYIEARLLIHDAANQAMAQTVAAQVSHLSLISMDDVQGNSIEPAENAPGREFDLDAPHSILFTSGTTGKPKGAVLTYGNHWWNAIGSALNLGLHENDVWLACMPLFHVGGLSILLRGVIYGIPVVLHESFDASAVNRALDEHKITIVSLVATMLRRVIEVRGDVPFPTSLRCVLLGGGPAPKDLLEECARRNVPVVQTYGLTEAASQVATLAPRAALLKLGSAGKPLMGIDLKIERGGEADGPVGEILIRGGTLLREYVNEPEATASAFRDGWFHTGDLGYLDKEGYLYVVARREDLIVSGGENIYPAEIEAVLNTHPAVLESAVVGVADEKWVQVPVAYVVRREGTNASAYELTAYCEKKVARFKVPARIHFVASLPRNAAGKVLRRAFQDPKGFDADA